MSLFEKMEFPVEMRTFADVVFGLFTSSTIDVSEFTDGKLTAHVKKGVWGKDGCEAEFKAPHWHNTHNTIRVKKIDNLKKKTDFEVIRGDVLKHYDNFSFSIQVTPKIGVHSPWRSVVHFTIEYKKKNELVPKPEEFRVQCVAFTEMVDHHINANKSIA